MPALAPVRPIAAPRPAPVLAPAPVEVSLFDPTQEIPEPMGYLSDGLRSPVIDPRRLRPAVAAIDNKLLVLKDLLLTPRMRYDSQATARGCSYWCMKPSVRIGGGSEGDVFVSYFVPNTADPVPGAYAPDPTAEMLARALPVAVKAYRKTTFQSLERQWFFSMDLNVFKSTDHPGIRYFDVFEMDMFICIMQELGVLSLEQYRMACRPVVKPEDRLLDPEVDKESALEKRKMVRALCLAVDQLHSTARIVHRDLRLPNVMLTREGLLKLCDFGLARRLPDMNCSFVLTSGGHMGRRYNCQPYEVMAAVMEIEANRQQRKQAADGDQDPDSANSGSLDDEDNEVEPSESDGDDEESRIPVGFASDIFMLGGLISYILTLSEPYNNKHVCPLPDGSIPSPIVIHASIVNDMPWMAHLLGHMLSHNRSERPRIKDVLCHPVFSNWWLWQGCITDLNNHLTAEKTKPTEHSVKYYLELLKPIEKKMFSDRHRNWSTIVTEFMPREVSQRIQVADRDLNAPLMMETMGSRQRNGQVILAPHPLPNMHDAVRWARNFFAHVMDRHRPGASFDAFLTALRNNNTQKAGEFFCKNAGINWLLPELWAAMVTNNKAISIKKLQLRAEMEKLQKEAEKGQHLFGLWNQTDA